MNIGMFLNCIISAFIQDQLSTIIRHIGVEVHNTSVISIVHCDSIIISRTSFIITSGGRYHQHIYSVKSSHELASPLLTPYFLEICLTRSVVVNWNIGVGCVRNNLIQQLSHLPSVMLFKHEFGQHHGRCFYDFESDVAETSVCSVETGFSYG